MTVEQQLAALAEADARIQRRHEALAQTVEILASMQRENERLVQELQKAITKNFEIVLDSIKRLENIAAAHEDGLDDLDSH